MLRVRKNLALAVKERQKEILIGCILGDAHITPLGKIRIEHSQKQYEYVVWKHSELSSLAYPALPRMISRQTKGKEYKSVFFTLRQYFRAWRAIFYEGNMKVFPERLSLTPLSLAVWYMDDGCWTGKKSVISIESFRGVNSRNMQSALYAQFGIETVVGKNRKLVIRKRSHDIFYDLISPHILPSMEYKLPNPVTTSPTSVGGS